MNWNRLNREPHEANTNGMKPNRGLTASLVPVLQAVSALVLINVCCEMWGGRP
jgi:hypothetical protein